MNREAPLVLQSALRDPAKAYNGRLIINADDWGRDRATTDPILECAVRGVISSVSGMVFMEDSERAAHLAEERRIDVGLHLNFTTALTAPNCPAEVRDRQLVLGAYLRRHALARVVFHPGLASSFEYVVAAQIDEFRRVYGGDPQRIDGHHHQHLCANVLFAGLLPEGTVARRNFSFQPGEKSFVNRLYRQSIDRLLGRKHKLVDYLFSLLPLEPASRLQRVVNLARRHVVELETHPINPEERSFLLGGCISHVDRDLTIATSFNLARPGSAE